MLEIGRSLNPLLVPMYQKLDDALEAGSRAALRRWWDDALVTYDPFRRFFVAFEEAAATEPAVREVALAALDTIADAMPKYLARWPRTQQKRARLQIADKSVIGDRCGCGHVVLLVGAAVLGVGTEAGCVSAPGGVKSARRSRRRNTW